MKKIKITDANGKEFEVSLSDITDMTTDLDGDAADTGLSDEDKAFMADFKPSIVDSSGAAFDLTTLSDEAGSNAGRLPKAIDVQFEATHSGRNRNSFIYHSDSMEADAASWKAPFAKPFLKNHNMYAEPMGRVVDFEHGPSQFVADRDTINVTYRITDSDAIEKFLDGRYQTMSIGGSVGHVSCSICNKDIVKDGVLKFCGHWRGETYDGQKAFWNARDIEYKEGSVVNAPADDWAQVKKITVVTEKAATKDEEGQAGSTSIKDEEDDILSIMDSLTDATDGQPEGGEANEGTQEGLAAEDGSEDGSDDSGDTTSDTSDEDGDQGVLDRAIAERDELKDEVAQLTADKEALEQRVADFTQQVEDLSEEIETLKQESSSSTSDAQNVRQQNIKLALLSKKVLAERAMDFERLSGALADDERETRASELVGMSAKDLTALVDGLDWSSVKTTSTTTVVGSIANPGLVDHEDPNAVVIGDNEAAKAKKEPVATMKDFEDTIINLISR